MVLRGVEKCGILFLEDNMKSKKVQSLVKSNVVVLFGSWWNYHDILCIMTAGL